MATITKKDCSKCFVENNYLKQNGSVELDNERHVMQNKDIKQEN